MPAFSSFLVEVCDFERGRRERKVKAHYAPGFNVQVEVKTRLWQRMHSSYQNLEEKDLVEC